MQPHTHGTPGSRIFQVPAPGVSCFCAQRPVSAPSAHTAAISVPTFQRVKENSAVRAAQTTLEAAARNGEAIAAADRDADDTESGATTRLPNHSSAQRRRHTAHSRPSPCGSPVLR